EGAPADEHTAIEDAGGDDVDAAFFAQWQQLLLCAAVEQRAAARDEEAIGVGLTGEAGEERSLVHANTHGTHGSLVAQSRQRAEGAAPCLLVMVVGVMHERDIASVEPEPVEALGERPQRPV